MTAPATAMVHNEAVTRLALATLVGLAAMLSACATTQARTATAGPTLAIPDPPPHEWTAGADTDPAARSPRAPAQTRPDKPESPPPAPPPAPVTATPPLQTTRDVAEADARVRRVLERASTGLDKIDDKALGDGPRIEYDTARRFIRQAYEALKRADVTYAEQLANKAATIADRLGRRTPDATGSARPS